VLGGAGATGAGAVGTVWVGVAMTTVSYDRTMTGDNAPKSRLELVMERLRKQDEEKGITQVTLTDAQREAIADAKRQHEARVAQRRILHQSALSGSFDPAAGLEREAELRRDLDRFEREHEEKLARIRRGES
jgi:hypothetical protein